MLVKRLLGDALANCPWAACKQSEHSRHHVSFQHEHSCFLKVKLAIWRYGHCEHPNTDAFTLQPLVLVWFGKYKLKLSVMRAFSIRFEYIPRSPIRNFKPAFQSALELKRSLRGKVLQWSRGAAAGTHLSDLLKVFGRGRLSTPLCRSFSRITIGIYFSVANQIWSNGAEITKSLDHSWPCCAEKVTTLLRLARVRFLWPPCNISPVRCAQTRQHTATYGSLEKLLDTTKSSKSSCSVVTVLWSIPSSMPACDGAASWSESAE